MIKLVPHKTLMMAAAMAVLMLDPQPSKAGVLSLDPGKLEQAQPAGIFELASARKRTRGSRRRDRSSRRAKTRTARSTTPKKSAAGNSLLFGTHETQSSNFKPFKKWSGAVQKMAKEQADLGKFKKRFKKWIVFLDGLKGKDRLTQIKAVNKFMNRSKYIQDNKNWGIKDYWASPGEFLSKFGDCEDYSIAKYMALKYLGHDAGKMRIVAVKDLNLKIGHAILAVYYKNRIVILDNQIKIVADSRKIRHYQPVYSINEVHWWRHRAT